MKRRMTLTVLLPLAGLAVLATGCGDSGGTSDGGGTTRPSTSAAASTTVPATSSPGTSSPATTSPATTVPAIEHPTGADQVVLRLAVEGGLVPAGLLFRRLPRLLIAGDGSAYVQGAVPAIYPGPLLPSVLVGPLSEAQVQDVLQRAQAARLFRDITYAPPPIGIADAPSTVLILAAGGHTYTHDAYALGMGGTPESDPDRVALAQFVASLEPIIDGVPGTSPFRAARYAIRAAPADEAPPTNITPNEVAWPAAAGVALAAATGCAVVDAAAVGDLFASATEITRFVDGGVKYVLQVRPLLPGDSC